MSYLTYIFKLFVGLLMVLNCNLSYANQDDNFELERFNVVVERMRENFQKIKDMKASRKVIGHERGFLYPFDRANLSPDEQKILEQENKDRSEYFSFLAKHSNRYKATKKENTHFRIFSCKYY